MSIFRLSPQNRLELLIDNDLFEEFDQGVKSKDPLNFKDKEGYKERLERAQERTGRGDGTLCGIGKIHGQKVSMAIMDFSFMGGSMGVANGEKIARVMERAEE